MKTPGNLRLGGNKLIEVTKLMNDILSIPMQENDAGAETIGDYLIILLRALWDKGECFSGKRPFGNSGWEYDLYHALVRGGVVKGEIDEEYDEILSFDRKAANKIIFDTIDSLYKKK